MYFIIEIDTKTLLHELNLPIVYLPVAMVTSWITWIKLFDFDIWHVSHQKHLELDGLLRRPPHCNDHANNSDTTIDYQIDHNLAINPMALIRYVTSVFSATYNVYVSTLENDDLNAYNEHHCYIIQFLPTMTVLYNVPKSKKCLFRI